jgi:hypothetical protein
MMIHSFLKIGGSEFDEGLTSHLVTYVRKKRGPREESRVN